MQAAAPSLLELSHQVVRAVLRYQPCPEAGPDFYRIHGHDQLAFVSDTSAIPRTPHQRVLPATDPNWAFIAADTIHGTLLGRAAELDPPWAHLTLVHVGRNHWVASFDALIVEASEWYERPQDLRFAADGATPAEAISRASLRVAATPAWVACATEERR